jgi:shikimate 5-dehydrogenase
MGWPISQSRSPMLHNFWFAQHGLAGSYVPLAIRRSGWKPRSARCRRSASQAAISPSR